MKFIGIPRDSKRRQFSPTSFLGLTLTLALLTVCAIGIGTLFNENATVQTSGESTVAMTVETQPTESAYPQVQLETDGTLPGRGGIDLSGTEGSDAEDTTSSSDEDTSTTTADDGLDESSPVPTDAPPTSETTVPPVAETPASGTYFVNGEVNVRSGPNTSFSIVQTLQAGDTVSVTSKTDNNWYRLTDGQYVSADLVTTAPTEIAHSGTYYVKGNVNVRTGPGTNYDVSRELAEGDPIEAVALTTNGWYKTIAGTYVRKDLCTSEIPESALPSPTPKPTPVPTAAPTPIPTPKPTPEPSEKGTYVGSFKIVYYGPVLQSDGSYSITTRTGTTCEIGRTIAVDPNVIALGSTVYIDGLTTAGNGGIYVAEDTGSGVKGNIIDIFVASEEEASRMNNGQYFDVYLK